MDRNRRHAEYGIAAHRFRAAEGLMGNAEPIGSLRNSETMLGTARDYSFGIHQYG